ncbi:MAG: hypothetical protein U0105_17795 [Candidatus Obscuribacterales bacterium]
MITILRQQTITCPTMCLEDMTNEVHGHMGRILLLEVSAVLLFCLAMAIVA